MYHKNIVSLLDKDLTITKETRKAPSPVSVMVQPVFITSNDRVFEAVGTGRAIRSVEIYPAVAEEVADVLFKAQDEVSKGDVLIQLDDREERLAVKLAEVRLKDARSLLSRYEQAVKEGAVPQSEVDSARADLESAQVTLDQAKLELEYRKVRAPFSGVVGIPGVDPGDRVNTDTLITGLDDRRILYVDFELPESLVWALREENTVTVTTPAYPERKFSGEICAQESRVDPERRTIMVRASIDNSEDLLRPGMSFTTRWEISGKEYPTVPEISLQWEPNGSYVWIVRDGHAEKVESSVIARTAGKVLLKASIDEGELVVVEGLQRLRPGRKVKILEDESLKFNKQVKKN